MRHLALAFVLCVPAVVLSQPTTITVTNDVIRKASDMEPLGVNNLGDVGGLRASSGNLIDQSGFEPVHMRQLYHVLTSGQDKGHYWVTLDGGGAGNWLLYTSGTFSGARMRAYRFLDAQGQPLPYKEVGWAAGGKLLDTTNVAQVKQLFDSRVLPRGTAGFPAGGWLAPTPGITEYSQWQKLSKDAQAKIKETWRVYYEADVPLQMDDLVIFEQSFLWPEAEWFHPRVRGAGVSSQWNAVVGQVRHVAHSGPLPPALDGGKGAMEVTPVDGTAECWHKLFGGTGRKDAFWYGTLDEGVTYRYETWAKVNGAASGKLHLGFGRNNPGNWQNGFFGSKVGKDFVVTDEWQCLGYEFVAPATPANGGIEGAILRYEGPGRLLVDNVKLQPVYEAGDAEKPFVIYRPLFDELMNDQPATGRKGALRSWSGLSEISMDDLLQWHRAGTMRLGGSIRVDTPHYTQYPKVLLIAEATGDSPETRMVPWLITQVTHDESEFLQLVEYLAAPYDPAKDTPETKPFAYRRTLHKGNTRPWTDEFREIILEVGNENWHNRANPEWLGVSRSGTVHQGGREMGVWLRHLVEGMRQSPYWNEAKLKMNFGGNYSAGVNDDGSVSGYGQEAVQTGGDTADYHSHATYIGPRWETGESSQTTIDDAGVQKTLLAYRLAKEEEWAKQEAAHKRLRELGFEVKMSAYEGGPSGFGLRAKTPEEDRAGEYYGKSYAMGTAMLDAWLDAWAKGWSHQCYLNFGQGRWWNSHTSRANGFRPSPGFQIQTLINHTLANRDMLAVRVADSPTLTVPNPQRGRKYKPGQAIPTKDIATIQAHAFGGANEVAVAISNLSLTEESSLSLKLPFATAAKITLHTLSGGPRDTNLDEYVVKPVVTQVDPGALKAGVFTATIPAGSPAVYVFER